MNISGEQLLLSAIDLIAEPGLSATEVEEVELAARHSVIVLDNLNLVPETAVGGAVRIVHTLPEGREVFTWGPGGDIDGAIPADISYWAILGADGTEYSRGARLLTPGEWSNRQQYDARGEPEVLYWPKTLVAGGRYELFVNPTPARPTGIVIYARVPKLDRISRNATYELDPGRGEHLMLQLAIAVAPVLGHPVPPSVYTRARAAADRLADTRELDSVQDVSSPRWLIGEFYDRRRHWGNSRW